MKPFLLCFVCVIFLPGILCADQPVKLIFDTDIQGDVDDVGSVALLHALANKGEVEILCMGVSCKNPWSPLCLDALNHYFGHPEIPIGVVKGPAFNKPSRYAQQIAENFPHSLKSAEDAPDAALLYRKILAESGPEEVVIISVGQLTNLSNLLKTKPDDISPLDGTELVKKHVKSWVCMGCRFMEGREANIYHDALPAKHAIESWPRPIIFSGFEIGRYLKTGGRLTELPESSPVRQSYQLFNGIKPHFSWDQTAVLFGVRHYSDPEFDLWKIHSDGFCHVDDKGRNVWVNGKDPKYQHSFLIENKSREEVEKVIEELMLYTPEGK